MSDTARIEAIERARADLEQFYLQRTPRSREQFAAACVRLPAGNTRSNLYFAPHPPTFAHAEGATLRDIDGNSYVDFISDFTVAINGHSHPRIRAALDHAGSHGWSWGGRNEAELALADAIAARFPAIEQLRFTNSGTEASLYALLLACTVTGRDTILVVDGGYHGGALSFIETAPRLNVPFPVVRVPYNDVPALEAAFAQHGARIAAVIVELVLNSGGCIPAEADFAEAARRLATDAGALFIADEVMTARLGWGGMQGRLGLRPDLTVLGKIIGGGFPCGAFGGRADLLARFDNRTAGALVHNGSFNNNVFSMTAGAAALNEVLVPGVLEALNEKGERLRERLNAAFRARSVALCYSGTGSVMALHASAMPPRRFAPSVYGNAVRALLHLYLLLEGLWVSSRGMIALNTAHTDAQIDDLASRVAQWCDRYHAILR